MRTLPIALAIAASSATAVAGVTDWNLISAGDVYNTSEVSGSSLIGGTLSGSASWSIAQVTAANGAGVAVAGDIAPGAQLNINNSGNLHLSGAQNGMVSYNGGSFLADGTVDNMVNSAISFWSGVSDNLATLASNGTLDNGGNLNATPTMLGGQNVAVYNLMDTDWQGMGQLNLNIGLADSIIINVFDNGDGQVTLNAPPNFVGGLANSANSSKILWNIRGATNIDVNNNFNGALIAPDAHLNLLGGGINGTVVVGSADLRAEVRLDLYQGYLPSVPAPSAATALGLGGLIATRRRRR